MSSFAFANDWLRVENKYLHQIGAFQSRTILRYAEPLKEIFEKHGVTDFLDYGCGSAAAYGDGALERGLGAKAALYDPYVKDLDVLSDLKFDAVVMIDVAEHIPVYALAGVFQSVFKRAKKVFVMTFCNRDAKKSYSNGVNVHITQRPYAWWTREVANYNKNSIPCYLFETP